MSVQYATVLWNPQKKNYDRLMLGLMILYLVVFSGSQLVFFPDITAETVLIRATGTLAFLTLHVILCIGPLCRINARFLPLLYNRRHLGVSMFLVALIHGILNLIQFHALGNTGILESLFASNTRYDSFVDFPFQVLGFFSLIILFLMAATSHDFWLKNLQPQVWKSLHMMVYAAYAMLVMHVMLGVIQLESSWIWIGLTGLGLMIVSGLHIVSAAYTKRTENYLPRPLEGVFVEVCSRDEIPENRARIIRVADQDIAIFRYHGKISAVSNVCRHQQGPLGGGKIVEGCITCPWHGYQYLPHNGQSPPPFTEKIETYDVKLIGSKVFVNPIPYPEGTERPPAFTG